MVDGWRGCVVYDGILSQECVEVVAAVLDGNGRVLGVTIPSDWDFVGEVVGCVTDGRCVCDGCDAVV